jgi:hypothetical protein
VEVRTAKTATIREMNLPVKKEASDDRAYFTT